MYCPNCGAESVFGLNYCKHCGGNLSETAQSSPPATKNTVAALILALATVGIVLGGLGIVFTNALAVVGSQPPGLSQQAPGAVKVGAMMVGFGSAAIVLVALMLIQLFSRMMGFGSLTERHSPSSKRSELRQRMPQIPAPPIVVSSVTEHTTRNFEPHVYQRDTSE
ncbi:MAG TPA: zinc ribbon domain-containing protein [Blastocatellia bacterium]|nr:zinc ribbon domain-containing protein [Blastocatellia bacterium]